jgi:flagellar protein FlaG
VLSALSGSALGSNEHISLAYNEETNRVIMRVVDSKTNEVLREVPSKNAVKLLQYMREHTGLFVDESR